MSNSLQEIVALFGYPVAGNPTQYLMEKAFSRAGLDWRYLTLDIAPELLADAMRGARAMGFRGGNLTMPHKVTALPLLQEHGSIASIGFRFGALAYSCDLSGLPAESIAALKGVDVWVVDALRYRPHPSHFSVDDALGWIGRIKPARAILTNLHSDLDYDALRGRIPHHVEPAYDGLTIDLECPG